MKENIVITSCTICKKEKDCTEEELYDINKIKEIQYWCKDCKREIEEEWARQKEDEMQEVYQDIIRSSYP